MLLESYHQIINEFPILSSMIYLRHVIEKVLQLRVPEVVEVKVRRQNSAKTSRTSATSRPDQF